MSENTLPFDADKEKSEAVEEQKERDLIRDRYRTRLAEKLKDPEFRKPGALETMTKLKGLNIPIFLTAPRAVDAMFSSLFVATICETWENRARSEDQSFAHNASVHTTLQLSLQPLFSDCSLQPPRRLSPFPPPF